MNPKATTVSVIIPTFNEAGTIADVIRGVRENTPSLEQLLIVDDGSTDGTADQAEQAGAEIIRLPVNGGKGQALRRGIAEATGAVLVFIDGDGQDDPAEIPTLVNALQDDVDMVIGSRFLGHFESGAITTLNRYGTRFLRATLNRLYGASVSDPVAGFRVIRKAALDPCQLKAQGYDIEVDVLLALLEQGRTVIEVPVKRYARTYGHTNLSSFRDGCRILGRILARRVAFSR